MEEDETGDCADWELLQAEEMTGTVNESCSFGNMNDLSGVGVHPIQILQTDRFSNHDWIYPMGELSFESSSDRYDDEGKFANLDGSNELNLDENEKGRKDFDELEALVVKSGHSVDQLSNSDDMELVTMKSEESESPQVTEIGENVKELEDTITQMDCREDAAVEAVKPTTEEEKRMSILWWKAPLNFLKCCAFRFKPIWTLSVVAAFMGFVIFIRRWHRMKIKSHGLKLKVTTDEKRETQLMNHVVRMNEAFSVVRRIPVIRPPLPAAGVTVTLSRMGSR